MTTFNCPKCARARQAQAGQDKRARIITAAAESLTATGLGPISAVRAHPPALQLRNGLRLVEIGADENTTSGSPASVMSTTAAQGSFMCRETAAAAARASRANAAPLPIRPDGVPPGTAPQPA